MCASRSVTQPRYLCGQNLHNAPLCADLHQPFTRLMCPTCRLPCVRITRDSYCSSCQYLFGTLLSLPFCLTHVNSILWLSLLNGLGFFPLSSQIYLWPFVSGKASTISALCFATSHITTKKSTGRTTYLGPHQ